MDRYGPLEIKDKGEVLSRSQVSSIVKHFTRDDSEIVVAKLDALTHWWLLTTTDGKSVIYFGTPETLKTFREEEV